MHLQQGFFFFFLNDANILPHTGQENSIAKEEQEEQEEEQEQEQEQEQEEKEEQECQCMYRYICLT